MSEELKELKELTVGELRDALDGIPDNLPVRLSSDSGVDQGYGRIIIESAQRVKYELPKGQKFSDTGETTVDYFSIYANDTLDDEDE